MDQLRNISTGGDANGDMLFDIENMVGSAHDDELAGDHNHNIIDGGEGDDILKGGKGDDRLEGNARMIFSLVARVQTRWMDGGV